jgi:hypothetical protein
VLVAPAAAEKAHVGYPNSIAVIGHSGATGRNSDPARPDADVIENSWATGTNPAVNSVYMRILAVNPAIRDHNVNLARDGATMTDIYGQAVEATTLKRKPELVLIQTIDNDISCGADQDQRARLANFRAYLTKALRILSRGLPNARIFIPSQFASVQNYAETIEPVPEAREANAGDGPCDIFDAAGQMRPAAIAFLQGLVDSYHATVQNVCAQFIHCHYDGGAFARARISLVRSELRLRPPDDRGPCQAGGRGLVGDVRLRGHGRAGLEGDAERPDREVVCDGRRRSRGRRVQADAPEEEAGQVVHPLQGSAARQEELGADLARCGRQRQQRGDSLAPRLRR